MAPIGRRKGRTRVRSGSAIPSFSFARPSTARPDAWNPVIATCKSLKCAENCSICPSSCSLIAASCWTGSVIRSIPRGSPDAPPEPSAPEAAMSKIAACAAT